MGASPIPLRCTQWQFTENPPGARRADNGRGCVSCLGSWDGILG